MSTKTRDNRNRFESRPVIDRLMESVEPEPFSGCWLWIGHVDDGGYGKIGVQIDGRVKMKGTHVVSYQHFIGPVPEGLELDHTCRVRSCCNPRHVEPVTHKVNCQRGLGGKPAGALKAARTHCPQGHPRIPANTYTDKRGHHSCYVCMKMRSAGEL